MHKKLSVAKIHLVPKKQALGNLPGENLGHNCPPASATPGFGAVLSPVGPVTAVMSVAGLSLLLG